jgi:thiol:disulfide interchange protein DsbG
MFRFMKTNHLYTTALLAGLLLVLAGCKDSAETSPAATAPAATAASQVSIPAIATEAKGFTVGSSMSVRTSMCFSTPSAHTAPNCGLRPSR